MKRVLIVKVSSLGDVIQAQAVVGDLHRAFPGLKVDWATDENFADIPRWNAGVARVLCAPLRRFKKARNLQDLKAIWASIADLRRERYDAVFDLHGVYKSAIISFLARSKRRFGYSNVNLGERGAAFAYTHRFAPRHDANAWRGMRQTLADTLGYAIEAAPPSVFAIPKPAAPLPVTKDMPYALLFHATSKAEKKWPLDRWIAVAQALVARGVTPLLPWGSDAERRDAEAIAQSVAGARVLPRLTLEAMAQHIALAALVVGTDTGLVHLASELRRPTVMIFSATSRPHFGVDIPGLCVSIGDKDNPPSVEQALAAIGSVIERF
ncbi:MULTISPECIES: lipopolysaccharide heptosyltransferase I [unclassified Caballeronia]|uniref:lipopolysaccharide heptosyltransferase I n=1 Tax=unclassified Caballeronia TaxID=2646786 RepID=UPI002864EF9A|nr:MULTISPECIES: lipopolysaccharide heptosyltransferase I [unclassified Caballeronia]MDR5738805.1 lipopolysaccharide heptosyltransferase I [Caballeronia sp. LZ016]MDR5811327.1 lipopolysaccharide heptosyltransferase I [Caballeronia sp. LZ019]